ncbi:MAG: SRPBCC family protein [Xanthomonadales bacterium]|nr:SRPBCC family protein [Xanthomonadales bacterium]
MRVIKELLLAAVITVVFFTVLMVMLPSSVVVERSIEINRPLVQVYDVASSFKQFPAWSPWGQRDPTTQYAAVSQELTGPGAEISWRSERDERVGEGALRIVEQTPMEEMKYELDAPWRGDKRARLRMEENEAGAIVTTFTVNVDYDWDLFGRVTGRYLDGHLGNDLNHALGQLKNRIEALPDVDYSAAFEDKPPVEVESGPINVMLIPGQASTREPYSIQPTVMNFTRILTATIDIKNLTQTGPRLAVLKRWGQNYDFDAAVPVSETEATDLPENVVFTTIGEGRYLKVNYQGARWDLPRQRDMLLAWAGAHGYLTSTGIIEEFLNDRGGEGEDAIRDADLETNIYLPLREPGEVEDEYDLPAEEEPVNGNGDSAGQEDADGDQTAEDNDGNDEAAAQADTD